MAFPITSTATSADYRQRRLQDIANTAPAAPPAPDYDAQFRSSLAQARSSVEAQLRNALGEIGRQESSQLGAVGALPGQYSQLYDMATQQAQGFSSEADAAVKAAGIGGAMPTAQAITPLLSAIQMGRATQQGGVPLLRLGVQDMAARQRGAINQAGMGMLAELAGEKRDYSRSRADEERRFSREDAQRRESYDREDAQRRQDFQNTLTLRQLDQQPAEKDAPKFGQYEVSNVRGAYLKETARWRSDSAYRMLLNELRKDPPEDYEELLARTEEFKRKHKKADPRAMSMALFDLYGGEPPA